MTIRSKRFRSQGTVWLAMLSILIQPMFAQAAAVDFSDAVRPIRVTDVELGQGGVLRGQVVGSGGQPLAKMPLHLVSGQQSLEVKTDDQGRFAIAGLNGSTYQLQVGGQVQLVRAWAAQTAPPSATAGVLIVPDDSAVLGQHCGAPVCGSGVCGGGCYGGGSRLARQRLILGGLIAAAIAIPIAIENGDDDEVNAEP